jgi:hypothetical protein
MRLLLPAGASIRKRRASGLAVSLWLHAAVVGLLILRSSSTDSAEGSADTQASGEIAIVAVPEDLLLPVDPADDAREDPEIGRETGLMIDEFTFDLDRIRRRRTSLFPFLTGDVLFLESVVEKTRLDPSALQNPLGARRVSDRPPLQLDVSGIQRIVDDAWSRRDRWTKFAEVAQLLRSHDPDGGLAADLVHAYLDQNLLQPYEDAATRDSKYWVMMELVSDHADFIDFIRRFARDHPSSRATTELLFLLDELAQGSLDSLLMLLGTDVRAELTATGAIEPEAFALAAEIDAYYRSWLVRHGLTSIPSVVAQYERMRLRILGAILESTPAGYRAADARFLIGQILFNQGDVDGALHTWRAIAPRDGDNYRLAYVQILEALDSGGRSAVPAIVGILGGERVRWLEFSRERLRAFGYEFNTF